MSEMFDVVNENDEVINQRPRDEVHRLGLLHRAVHVLVFNREHELFLQKRSMLKDCYPGTWDSSASGHLAPGETYDECAIRELKEELGLESNAPLEPLFKIDACPETGLEFVWVYETKSNGPFQLQPEEIETGGWFDCATIRAWIQERPREFASGFVLIWRILEAKNMV